MMTKGIVHKNCKSHYPRGSCRGFVLGLRSYSEHACIRQIKYKAIMTKEGSTKIVNFTTIGAGDLMLGRGYLTIVNMHFLILYQYISH